MQRVDLSAPLVTIEDVIRLREERDQVQREIARLSEQFEVLDSKLNAISLWIPPEVKYQILDSHISLEDQKANSDWEHALTPIFIEKGHGLTTGMIRSEMKGHPMESEIGYQGRALYKALTKMVSRKKLVRDEDYYMLPGQQKPDDGEGRSMAVILRTGILDFFAKNPGSYHADEVRQGLEGTKAGEIAYHKASSFYNAVSKLAADNKLVREGRTYRLPFKENEPHDAGASHGSDAGSGGDIFS